VGGGDELIGGRSSVALVGDCLGRVL